MSRLAVVGSLCAALSLAGCGSKARASDATPRPSTEDASRPATAGAERAARSEDRAPAPPAAASPARKPGSNAQRWVDAHNRYRATHCAPALTWSPELAAVAQKWADTLAAKGCAFGHSPGATYGENLAAGTSGALDPESTVTMWYDEVAKYSFAKGAFSMETGHFTQVVWTTTKHVGCGQVTCKGTDIYVCNYDPPGNWEGQYRQHVLPASCKK